MHVRLGLWSDKNANEIHSRVSNKKDKKMQLFNGLLQSGIAYGDEKFFLKKKRKIWKW